jgi:4-amino-4-deoxy-L-arabinose transferase-like glycosyltransferase
MIKKEPQLNLDYKKSIFSKYSIIIVIIIGISCLIRFYYLPTEIPLTGDALYYFWYSSDIYQIGSLPNNWTPTNNGWSIFVSTFFTVFDSKDIFELMQAQRILSTLISILITIPVYFLCKKFVERKFAIIGATLIAFEPRLILNSFLGITDPLYLLLITSGLVFFLSSNKKLVFCSFIAISLAVITRGEGIFLLTSIFILFFIKYRKEKYKLFFYYIIILVIILLILVPITNYRIDVNGYDPIFTRNVDSANEVLVEVTTSENINSRIFEGSKVFTQFLIWIMIPNFIIFIPIGIFLIFKQRNFNKNILIITSVVMAIPAFYAYTFVANPALDTRYLYVLFPMFSILSVLAIQKICEKIPKSNIIIIVIILAIIVASISFYDYKKIDYEHEKESFEVMQKISPIINGTNILYPETSYFKTIQTIDQWPIISSKIKFDITTVPTSEYDSLQEFILYSKETGLSHIIIDNNSNREEFLNELFFDETKYPYLKKIFDSKDEGFNYHVKLFKINYDLFSLK